MNEEKNRKLSAKEQKRISAFEETCESFIQQGYKKNDLTISIVKANLFVLLLAIPVVAIGVLLFAWRNPMSLLMPTPQGSLLFIVVLLVLIVAHELIHGLTWSMYAEHHFKDIEFGFMKEYLTPYCTCTTPLLKSHYITGALMPFIVRHTTHGDRDPVGFTSPVLDWNCDDIVGGRRHYDCLESTRFQKTRRIQRSPHLRPSHPSRLGDF